MRIKKDLRPVLPHGGPVYAHHAKTQEDEAVWIAEQVKRLSDGGTAYRDMAALYRAYYVSRSLEEVFLREKIPYILYSGVSFFQRREIKDALAYLRMTDCQDDLSFLRIANVPKRNLGKRRMAFLQGYAVQRGCTFWQALTENLDAEIIRSSRAEEFVSLIDSIPPASCWTSLRSC